METFLLALLGLLAGAGLPVHAALNTALRQQVGRPEWAALVNFLVGSAGLAALLLALRTPLPPAGAWGRAPWWSYTGGLLGAFFVALTVVLTPRLGVVATVALLLAGQMVGAALLDHHGLLGLAVRSFTPQRALGLLLLAGGVFLVQR
ncbi:MAG: DMT family transporter [Deltaproteobacteria bacterium]|nr:DMT family transporter [Deltaproteobacteria bacterium]